MYYMCVFVVDLICMYTVIFFDRPSDESPDRTERYNVNMILELQMDILICMCVC